MAIKSMVGRTDPLYVSFYTPDYEPYADRLQESLDRANVGMCDRHLKCLKSEGSWLLNCAMKPAFLFRCLEEFQRPLVWVDADAKLNKWTGHFQSLSARSIDVAAHRPDRRRHPRCNSALCSGTLFFNNTPAAQDVLMDWIVACQEKANALDQDVLNDVLFGAAYIRQRDSRVAFEDLPAEYCAIFDLMADIPPADRVIEHFQASRQMR